MFTNTPQYTVLQMNYSQTIGSFFPPSVPSPRVHITRTPSTGVYPTTRLNLTCITVMNPEVDTPMTVTHSWRGPSGSIPRYSSRPSISSVTRVRQEYRSSLFFSFGIRASDSGTYYCTSSTLSASSYVVTSGSVAASTSITVGKEDGCTRLYIALHA